MELKTNQSIFDMKVLSKAELRVAEQIAWGHSEKEIAEKLCISPFTVHSHAYTIRKKLNARGAVDIARAFILSLDDPKKYFLAAFFLLIQASIIAELPKMQLRRAPVSRVKITRTKGGRKKEKEHGWT
jgi:DNA-binding CsgD family transcriptional regulator